MSDFIVYLDESHSTIESSSPSAEQANQKLHTICAIVTHSADGIEERIKELADAALADSSNWQHPSLSNGRSRRDAFQTDGFHYTADSDTLRNFAVQEFAKITFRAHLYFYAEPTPSIDTKSYVSRISEYYGNLSVQYAALNASHPKSARKLSQAFSRFETLATMARTENPSEIRMLTDHQMRALMYRDCVATIIQQYRFNSLHFVFETESTFEKYYHMVAADAIRLCMSSPSFSAPPVSFSIQGKTARALALADYSMGVLPYFLASLDSNLKQPRGDESARFNKLASHISHLCDIQSGQHWRPRDIMNAPTGDQRSTDVDERSNSWPSSGLRIRNDPSGPFYYVKSLPALLAKLHITPQQVQTATTRNQSQSAYRVRYISSHGRKRQLEIPEDRDVRHVQGRIAQLLGPASGLLRENIYGYVPGRQALSMAMAHSGNGYLLHLDIRQFFRNCTLDAITKGLEEIGAHPDIAEFIAATCTYRGYLPTGARTSPVLSNILFIPLDDQLATLATENGVKYTRYADDLFFSAPTLAQLESLRVKAKMVLEDSGFQTSPRKEYLGKIEMAPKIVGVRFDNQSQPRIPRKLRRRLTSDFLAWERYIERQSNWEECCISQGDWIKSETEAPKQPNSTWSEVIGRAYYCFRIDPEWLMKMMDKYPNARKSIWDARRHRTPRRDLAMAAIPLTLIEHSPGIGHEVILVDERGSVDPLVRLLAARRTPTPCPPAPEGVA